MLFIVNINSINNYIYSLSVPYLDMQHGKFPNLGD